MLTWLFRAPTNSVTASSLCEGTSSGNTLVRESTNQLATRGETPAGAPAVSKTHMADAKMYFLILDDFTSALRNRNRLRWVGSQSRLIPISSSQSDAESTWPSAWEYQESHRSYG